MGRRAAVSSPPVFILTHYPREALEFANGTSFHFVEQTPEGALRLAQDAAGELDVRIGGGPSTVNEFLRADLIDFLHVAIVPIVLGSGVRIWDELVGLENRFSVESIGSTSGLTRQLCGTGTVLRERGGTRRRALPAASWRAVGPELPRAHVALPIGVVTCCHHCSVGEQPERMP